MAKSNPANADLPGLEDDLSDIGEENEFFLDFSDVEAADGFPVVPRGWYKVRIIDDNDRETKNPGKMPQGTPGISFTMVIIEGKETDKKVFTNFWLHPTSFPYFKNFMQKSGQFTEEELSSKRLNPNEVRQRLMGAELWADVRVKQYQGNDQNDIKGFKHLSEREAGSTTGTSSSILPD